MSVRIVHIRRRTHRHKHLLAIRRKIDGARPVATAAGQIGDMLRRAARLQIAVVIRKANHFVGVADINPLRIRPRRIKRNPVRTLQAAGENLHLFRLAVAGHAAKHANAPGIALGQKNVAVGSGPQQSRILQSRGIHLHLESRRRHRPRILRTRHQLGAVVRRWVAYGCGKIFYRDLASRPRLFVAEIGKRRDRRSILQFCRYDFRHRASGCAARSLARRHRLHISHNLPARLFRQKRPGWHPVVLVALGDEPEHFARQSRPSACHPPAKARCPCPFPFFRGRPGSCAHTAACPHRPQPAALRMDSSGPSPKPARHEMAYRPPAACSDEKAVKRVEKERENCRNNSAGTQSHSILAMKFCN